VIDRLGGALDQPRISGETFQRRLTIAGEEYPTVFVPVRSADDQVIGLMALSQRSDVLEGAQRDTTRTLFLIALLAMILAALLAFVSGGRVTRPIRSLTHAARELRSGNYAARAKVRSHDEVGSLGGAFNEMAEELQRKTGELRSAARSEASLRAHMEAIVQSMGDALIATDADGAIVMFNRAAEQMMKRRADSAIGCHIGDVMQGTTEGGRRLSEAAMTARAMEGTLVRGGGSQVPIAMTAAPLLDTARDNVGRVVVIRDVTREHEAERMKSEFLSNVSHELRTPITPIKGYAEILKRKRFPREKTEQFLNGVLESTERLERIVEILVDFASMEAGRLKPRADAVPVDKLLGSVSARWEARSHGHRFVRKDARGVPSVVGDERLLERCLNELVDNAVKFSPDGGKIELSADTDVNGTRRRKASKVKITVRDHGIGIEPERLPELFQDFRQLDGSETRSYGGLGLGLAYVKRIANVHGGDVTVESTPGRGTAFSLLLPAADVPVGIDVPERLVPAKRVRASGGTKRTPARAGRKAAPARKKSAGSTKKRKDR
jgi:two-component system sensor histidine kinase VicK